MRNEFAAAVLAYLGLFQDKFPAIWTPHMSQGRWPTFTPNRRLLVLRLHCDVNEVRRYRNHKKHDAENYGKDVQHPEY